jgi:hypothetical protein
MIHFQALRGMARNIGYQAGFIVLPLYELIFDVLFSFAEEHFRTVLHIWDRSH